MASKAQSIYGVLKLANNLGLSADQFINGKKSVSVDTQQSDLQKNGHSNE